MSHNARNSLSISALQSMDREMRNPRAKPKLVSCERTSAPVREEKPRLIPRAYSKYRKGTRALIAIAERIDKNFLQNAIFAIHATLTAVPIWFVLNLSFLDTFSQRHPGYTWFNAHGSQHEWAVRFFVLASCGFVGLVFKNRWIRLASAGALGVGHAFIATAIALSNSTSFGVGTYAIMAVLAVWRIWLEK